MHFYTLLSCISLTFNCKKKISRQNQIYTSSIECQFLAEASPLALGLFHQKPGHPPHAPKKQNYKSVIFLSKSLNQSTTTFSFFGGGGGKGVGNIFNNFSKPITSVDKSLSLHIITFSSLSGTCFMTRNRFLQKMRRPGSMGLLTSLSSQKKALSVEYFL